ncbi:hypothetical protein KJ763_02805, partial [Patescibacteria group bacterium]|nr:hypothetical protein [Patescibacteria group bacterium]
MADAIFEWIRSWVEVFADINLQTGLLSSPIFLQGDKNGKYMEARPSTYSNSLEFLLNATLQCLQKR